jgi:type IV pilus assembly protein PilB
MSAVQTKPDLRAPFGEWLVAEGLIDQASLDKVYDLQNREGGSFKDILQRLDILNNSQVTAALEEYLFIERVLLDDEAKIDKTIARMIPENVAKRFNLLAFAEEDNKIVVAMADPEDLIALDTVSLRLKREIKPVISSADEIQKSISAVYHGSYIDEENLRDLAKAEIEKEDNEAEFQDDLQVNIEQGASEAPVIRFVDLCLSQAIKCKASDLHIEPQEKAMNIRMRIDGLLRDMVPPPRKMQPSVIARIKILAQMDVAERRLPQDGRFKVKTPDGDVDIRVSSLPGIYGENIVMRILDQTAVNHDLDILGFEPKLLETLKMTLRQPHGIVLVTGPTGSGKSTTLYSALNYLRNPHKKIITVEDPVEYRLEGINQIQTKSEIGLDFAKCLRAILRQDPDIVLIGEMRDKETVEIAMKASLTGHLVLSTFHTNDAPAALTRLVYMGIDRYLLASTLGLVIAQRLVRLICESCKEPTEVDAQTLQWLNIDPELSQNKTFYHGRGCGVCNGTGYLGRMPIFEFLAMSHDICKAVIHSESEAEIRALSRNNGYGGLLESGVTKLMAGLTTANEVLNAAFCDDTTKN